MSAWGRGVTTINGWRENCSAPRPVLAGLLVLACVACLPSIASADVDMTGRLERVASSLRAPNKMSVGVVDGR